MSIIKKYPLLFAFMGFLIFTLPQAIDSYVNLYSKFKEANIQIDWYSWVFPILPIIGVILFVVVIWQIRKAEPNIKRTYSPTTSWIEQLASQDLENLTQRIKVEVREVHFNGLQDKIPHIRLIVKIINTSIFDVRVSQCVGFIQLNGYHCVLPQPDRLPNLAHGTSGRVELHQSLNDETAKWLIKVADKNNRVNVVCIMCRFVFQVTSEGYNKQIEIPIRDGGLPCIPKGIIVVSDGYTGTVMN